LRLRFLLVRAMIETTRLRLRPLRQDDCTIIVGELNNFKISRNLARVPYPYHYDDAVDFLGFVKTLDQRSLVSGIEIKFKPGQLIGAISYEYDAAKNNADFGYWLSEAQWGKGYGKEAARAVVRHAFTVSKLETLISCYHDDNPNSGRILRGVGFEEVAQCTSFSKAQGMDVPVTNMRLTRANWLAQQKGRGE
jgi:RimJ/RimL family protein N-acetyltransferase